MRNSFFLNRKDYKFRPFTDGGLSGNKQFAIPKQGDGVAYELLVIDQQVCDKAFFDAALDDMCSRFLSIPNEEVESMLEALGAQYPAALIDHFKLYIDKIREFCQK